MTTEQQPSQGQRVEVWSTDGKKVFEGTVHDVLIRSATDKAAEIVIKADAETSDAP